MSLRFLLDEDVPPAVAEGLRRAGSDAASVHEEGRTGLPDEEQLAYAAATGRVLVTYNRSDFQALDGLWHVKDEHHKGIVWVAEKSIPRRAIVLLVRSIYHLGEQIDALDDLIIPLQRGDGEAESFS